MDCYSCFSPVKSKEKKQLLLLISLVQLHSKGNPGKYLLMEENRWIINYTWSTALFFLKKKIRHPVYFKQYFMHQTGKTLNLTIPCLSIKFMHHMFNFGLNHTSLVNPLPICYSYIRMFYSEHIPYVTKLMGTGSDQLRSSFGRNNTMGSIKGTSPFASKL